MVSLLVDFLFPKFCFSCGRPGRYICDKCFAHNSEYLPIQICHVCHREVRIGLVHKDCQELSFLDGLLTTAQYNDFTKNLIFSGKYSGVFSIFYEVGEIMAQNLKLNFNFNEHLLIPVPLHISKMKKRGYNQSLVIAKSISKFTGIKVIDLIERRVKTHTQVGMHKTQRQENLLNAFTVKNKGYMPKKAILIDDVYTTGTTLNECAKVLKEHGVKEVIGYTFAKATASLKPLST